MPSLKDIDWSSIGTKTIIAVLGIVMSAGGWVGTRIYGKVASVYADVQSNTKKLAQYEQMQKTLEQIAIDSKNTREEVKQITRRQLTIQGKARVESQGDDLTMKINEIGKAADYSKLTRARVTNTSDPDQSALTINIIGTFRNVDSNYLIMLSRRAGMRLGANAGTINVLIEPVEEK